MSALLRKKTGGANAPHHAGEDEPAVPEQLPVLPLKNTVIFPLTVVPLLVQTQKSIRLIDEAVAGDRLVALSALRDPEIEDAGPDDVQAMGTLAIVHRLARASDGDLHLIVQGLERIRIVEFTQSEPYMRARVEIAPDQIQEGVETEALMRSIGGLFERLADVAAYIPEEVVSSITETTDPRQLAYTVATSIRMSMAVRQEILEFDLVSDKLRRLLDVLTREVDVLELGKKIQTDAQSGIEKVQREYFLREQLKVIQQELGEENEQAAEVRRLRARVEAAGMPAEAEAEAVRELDRLAALPTAAAEYGVIRTYLDWLLSLPWQVTSEDKLDVREARRVLDEDHYDLERVKERILEYLAVRKLRQERAELHEEGGEHKDRIRREREGAILCFVGPPGVGKTSLGQSVARAMGREFIRQSVGGVHDEAEIRGHRRTYIGAMPGRIIQAIRRAGSRNPVFMLDEVDKIGADFRGDPSSALLEVLDPEQNREFRDHYLGVPFDLSRVMFITTANVLDTIPAPLRDRMEILHLSGYTEEEKLKIAQGYLIARQIRENGLRPEEIAFEEPALRQIIRAYTREAGVRELERQIGAICRKVATRIASGSEERVLIKAESIPSYLRKPLFYQEVATRTAVPGVATGLAWTPTGGDILFIEATKMKGDNRFMLTGQLGEVMRESAQAALSYVRSKAETLGIDETAFEQTDIHLHIPAGAIPKDGPSAGVTMATTLASLMRNEPVNGHLGMTGEITLRGQVLPVGGIKEKLLAAHRAGLDTVCLPRRNEKDLEELPSEIQEEMNIILVDRVEQVFEVAFEDLQRDKRVKKRKNKTGPEGFGEDAMAQG
ncbi:MAG: endopeptidase La [Anaerolineae bacterium]|nr:endopeptidase La [Anaerolineae bacterium]